MRRIAWTHYAAPQTFYGLAGVCWKPLALLALALALAGMWVGFMVAPADAQQGEGYRIIFVHVPVSWMSMIIYLAMAFWGVVRLVGVGCSADVGVDFVLFVHRLHRLDLGHSRPAPG